MCFFAKQEHKRDSVGCCTLVNKYFKLTGLFLMCCGMLYSPVQTLYMYHSFLEGDQVQLTWRTGGIRSGTNVSWFEINSLPVQLQE